MCYGGSGCRLLFLKKVDAVRVKDVVIMCAKNDLLVSFILEVRLEAQQ